jgi:hypothetical protein
LKQLMAKMNKRIKASRVVIMVAIEGSVNRIKQ